jgi:hypothetical protein
LSFIPGTKLDWLEERVDHLERKLKKAEEDIEWIRGIIEHWESKEDA